MREQRAAARTARRRGDLVGLLAGPAAASEVGRGAARRAPPCKAGVADALERKKCDELFMSGDDRVSWDARFRSAR